MKTKILLFIVLSSFSLVGFSKVWEIANSGNTFTPSTITINQGDTINFTITAYHNARQVDQRTWDNNGTALLSGGFDVPFNGGMVYPEQLEEGTHYFVCTPHVTLGMKGTIIVQGATAISQKELLSDISIYPNPAANLINVKAGNNLLGSNYIILDQTGRQVLNGRLTQETTLLDISQLATGFYFFQFGEQQKQTFKLVKK